ncbi:hypothetical protein OG497_36725 [Streptomyces sp. NBC_01242]|uniref:hypothetical protein n=1 Tax=unclassified Streptomyces TaxID=2593676 RepID=UPI00225812C3|nr:MULTISPECIES: hypothetical protein [unclassified Streptomyces]MCX4799426.1 hypothetical protein [Streptomyces sp. NBC_01242]WSJ40704.1 hypothetical protein OG772_35440 [Streptomyces sp. NBC_01321]
MKRPLPALILKESTLALRSPLLWALALVTVAGRIVTTWKEMPDWSGETVNTATSALVIGAGAMLAGNLAILRDARSDAVELTEALPVRPQTRTLGVLVAYPLAGVLVAAPAMGIQLGSLLIGSRPTGHADVRELVTGLLLVALMGALGVAAGCWIPGLIAAPIGIVLFFWTLVQFPSTWLLPVVPELKLAIDPVRPPGWHLLYVAALVLLAGSVALLRHGRRPVPVITAVSGAAAVVVAGALTLNSPAAKAAAQVGDLRQSTRSATAGAEHCRELNTTRYCAFPAYAAWIPLWQGAVDPVVAAVPEASRERLPGIVQRAATGVLDPAVTDGNILTTTSWGRNGAERASRRTLAAQMAAAAGGLPWGTQRGGGPQGCDARGQARTVVALWLIGQVEQPVAATTKRTSIRTDDGGQSALEVPRSDLGSVDYGEAELGYAKQLLAQPAARERIWEHWAVLTAPTTTVDQALPLLGLGRSNASAEPKGTPCE